MLSTFIMQLKTMFRDPQALFWMIAFPIILSTLIYNVYGNLAESVTIQSQPVAVVADTTWKSLAGAQDLMDTLSKDSSQRSALISTREVASREDAERYLRSGDVKAYVFAEDSDDISMAVSDATVASMAAADANGGDSQSWALSALHTIIDQFNERGAVISETLQRVLQEDPSKLADSEYLNAVIGADRNQSYVKEVSVLHVDDTPDMSRYMFTVIGLMAMMGMITSLEALANLQPNESLRGMRLYASPMTRTSKILSLLASTWLINFLTLSVVFVYIRFVLGITIGGRDALAILAIMVASFTSQGLGLLFGVMPKLTADAKRGICVGVSLALSVIAGLQGTMALSDAIQRNMPWLHVINPVKQVSNLFIDLLYFDSLAPFAATVGICMAMGVCGTVISVIVLGKERYDNL